MLVVTFLLVGVTFVIILFVLTKWWIGRSAKVRLSVLICLLLISLLSNAAFLVHRFASECFIGGDGQIGLSPNGFYIAKAITPHPCFRSQPAYHLLTIESHMGQLLKTIRIDPAEPNGSDHFRELPQIIHWSPNSREVEFRVPGIRLNIMVGNSKGVGGISKGVGSL